MVFNRMLILISNFILFTIVKAIVEEKCETLSQSHYVYLSQKEGFDLQLNKFIYGTNIIFEKKNLPAFMKMENILEIRD